MKTEVIDIQYSSVEDVIETLKNYVGLGASIAMSIEHEPYHEDSLHVVVTVEIPGGHVSKKVLKRLPDH